MVRFPLLGVGMERGVSLACGAQLVALICILVF